MGCVYKEGGGKVVVWTYAVLEIIFLHSQDICHFKSFFWSDISQIGLDIIYWLTTWKVTQDMQVRCAVIVSDHNVKLARHFQNLVEQCLVTHCYFQHCTWINFSWKKQEGFFGSMRVTLTLKMTSFCSRCSNTDHLQQSFSWFLSHGQLNSIQVVWSYTTRREISEIWLAKTSSVSVKFETLIKM